MALPSPEPHIPNFGRIDDLLSLRDQLRNNDLKARFACSFYLRKRGVYCDWDCGNFEEIHFGIFKNARTILRIEVELVGNQDFIAVLRTIFCDSHDPRKIKAYQKHLEELWSGASMDVRRDVWEALRESGRNIYTKSPQLDHPATDPVQRQFKSLRADQGISISSPCPNSNAPGRSQSAQPKLGHSFKPSVDDTPVAQPGLRSECIPSEDDICASPSSPTVAHTIRKSKARHAKSTAERSSKDSAQISSRLPSPPPENTKSTENTKSLNGEQVSSAHITNKPFQNLNPPRNETILERLARSAKPMNHHQIETAEDSTKRPISVPQNRHSTEEVVTRLANFSFDIQKNKDVFAYQPKLPAATPKYGSQTLTGSFPETSDVTKPSANSPVPENAAVEEDAPNSSDSASSGHNTPQAKQTKAAASPATKGTPRPVIERARSSAEIHYNIYQLLRIPIGKGGIYILQAPAFFENYEPASKDTETWYKIGISSQITERINSLESKCGITGIDLVHCWRGQIDQLKRIEKLCHEELKNFQRMMDCKSYPVEGKKCRTVHKEWFAVEKDIAVGTVERWSKFLEQNPYGEDGYMSSFWNEMANKTNSNSKTSSGSMEHAVKSDLDTWLEESIEEWKARMEGKRG